ncbi:hypothetical protein BRSU_2811 [Brachyspira suanatina]|uniref:Lipopolysaccharide biosynthesis protein n=1 Tax=Brachyspira suanatina TaxID=381802 RepID=A0A0G4KAX6_9SPIR|nr:rhamnan synthesis F family protein [Brachyspira suanatina]CRF35697.1 hypothetical protein BRSU_2811 [Brachyspira suanatina]
MKRLAIFAGYDKDNIIDDYVVYYIKELKKIADIIYVSDCNILENELAKISEYCINIINGRHGEYDFGSYKRGYIYAKENNILQNYDYLILCNDSCYGPFFNFQKIVENIESKNSDIWGIFKYLKDIDFEEHLQSYFLAMTKNIFLSNWYSSFLLSVKKEENKKDIIKKYEIGMSILFKNHNCSMSSFLDSSFIENPSNNSIPSVYALEAISYGFPLLKIAIFGEPTFFFLNKEKIKKIFKIIQPYDKNIIINHLNRTMKKENIKYLFPKFKTKQVHIFSKSFLNISFQYSVSGKFQIAFFLFNKLKITIDFPKSISYNKTNYNDFNFLLEE